MPGGMRTQASSGMWRDLQAFGEEDRFSDPHHAHRDSGTLAGGGIAQIDAGIHGAGRQPELALREVGHAHHARLAQHGLDGAFQVGGDELAGHQQAGVRQLPVEPRGRRRARR